MLSAFTSRFNGAGNAITADLATVTAPVGRNNTGAHASLRESCGGPFALSGHGIASVDATC